MSRFRSWNRLKNSDLPSPSTTFIKELLPSSRSKIWSMICYRLTSSKTKIAHTVGWQVSTWVSRALVIFQSAEGNGMTQSWHLPASHIITSAQRITTPSLLYWLPGVEKHPLYPGYGGRPTTTKWIIQRIKNWHGNLTCIWGYKPIGRWLRELNPNKGSK